MLLIIELLELALHSSVNEKRKCLQQCINILQYIFFYSDLQVNLALIMSINPGFGGQSFNKKQVKKISNLRRLCAEKGVNPWIVVHGGVGPKNAYKVEGLRGIMNVPAKLESTTLVFAYGVDIFITQLAPSRTYNSLTEDFQLRSCHKYWEHLWRF